MSPTIRVGDRFRRFRKYTPSKVDWVSEIPSHWNVRRLKYLCSLNQDSLYEDTDPDFEFDYVDIGNVNDLGQIAERETLRFGSAPSRARRLTKTGDVIVSTVRTYLRAIAQIREVDDGLVVSTGFAVIRPSPQLDAGFAAYAFRAPYFVESVVANSKGVSFPAISETELATIPMVLPPIDEQRAIGAFLDRETARIDALIERKERLLELTQERQTAQMDTCLSVSVQGSPMVRLGLLASVVNGSTPSRENRAYWADGTVPWLTSGKINEGEIRGADEFVSEVAYSECHLPMVPKGSILVALTGEGKTRGKVAMLATSATISQHLAAIVARSNRLNDRFLWRYLESQYLNLRAQSGGAGSTRGALTCDFLKSLRIPVPPAETQLRIEHHLQKVAAESKQLRIAVAKGIRRILEYRSALIASAIAGQIDVREGVA